MGVNPGFALNSEALNFGKPYLTSTVGEGTTNEWGSRSAVLLFPLTLVVREIITYNRRFPMCEAR
jgi:hypothetical protein